MHNQENATVEDFSPDRFVVDGVVVEIVVVVVDVFVLLVWALGGRNFITIY